MKIKMKFFLYDHHVKHNRHIATFVVKSQISLPLTEIRSPTFHKYEKQVPLNTNSLWRTKK